ncbi:hypothetical protein BBO99_00004458 [Phytophthora kernoviae]|uniref:DUSP domain-containing protein n=2 Tax=Phytophthora kernoviae TaxID=325452 RepID=A0A3R7HBH6_9STRA|nr:hypothetical protein G195_005781 [Phytophthora kernoviae 00238/432]KAG2524218.1 hypothetical protein JM16_005076 [Phytophthora kernoviae]KAG2525992.1 hypothetical protein JM18_004601 [Phytophthora kernoviae]RLN44680.1 hypothetical protein BBI17_005068 [Phytophthora kernoviae]RLN80484.1 hypothetical protein BBO99_00004458 [Phytophthora kernoviae]
MTRNYQLGDAWFVVSTGWWQRVVGRLMEDVDYRLVSERVWRALALEFGFDWEIRREVVTMGRRLTVDVYPAGLEERVGHSHVTAAVSGSGSAPTSPPSSPERTTDLSAVAMDQWRNDLKMGQLVDALDTDSKWYEARIVDLADARAKVHYRGWSAKWDEWLARTSPRLMPLHTKVRDWRRFRVNDEVQVGEERPGKKRMQWRDATVLATVKSLLVQLQIDEDVHWMDAQDERLCPPGTHRTVNGAVNAETTTPSSGTSGSSNSFINITPTAARRKRLKTASTYSSFDN